MCVQMYQCLHGLLRSSRPPGTSPEPFPLSTCLPYTIPFRPATCRRSRNFCVAHTPKLGTRLRCTMYSLKAYPDGRTCMYMYICFSPDGLGCKSVSLAEGSPWEWSSVPRVSVNTGAPPGSPALSYLQPELQLPDCQHTAPAPPVLPNSVDSKFIRHFLFVSLPFPCLPLTFSPDLIHRLTSPTCQFFSNPLPPVIRLLLLLISRRLARPAAEFEFRSEYNQQGHRSKLVVFGKFGQIVYVKSPGGNDTFEKYRVQFMRFRRKSFFFLLTISIFPFGVTTKIIFFAFCSW